MKKYYFLCLTGILGSLSLWAQPLLTGFETDQVTSPTQIQLPAAASGNGIITGDLMRGPGLSAIGTAASTFSAGSFNVPSFQEAVLQNKFVQFTTTAAAGSLYTPDSLQFTIRRTATGPQFFQWLLSFDGGSSFYAASPELFYDGTATNGFRFETVLLPPVQSWANLTQTTTLIFRLYAWGASSAAGLAAFGRQSGYDLALYGALQTNFHPGLIIQLPTLPNTPPSAPDPSGLAVEPICAFKVPTSPLPVGLRVLGVTNPTAFTLELSDSAGNFGSPQTVATGMALPTDSFLQIPVNLPTTLKTSSLYRMRVHSATVNGTQSVAFAVFDNLPAPQNLTATPGNTSLILSWDLPPGCWDQVYVFIGEQPLAQLPTGDGSGFVANSDYSQAPLALGNARNVYIGHHMQTTVNGLINDTTYYISIFTRSGTTWSAPVTIQAIPERPVGGWPITQSNTALRIDFDQSVLGINNGSFGGLGLGNPPQSGQLDSRSWRILGMSDAPATSFGSTLTTGDFARGVSSGGIGTGGLWAFEITTGNKALGVQPLTSDFNPGSITLRLDNRTVDTLTSLQIAFTTYVFNDQDRSSDWVFSHGPADHQMLTEPDWRLVTPELRDNTAQWKAYKNVIHLSGLQWLPQSTYQLQWSSADAAGAGSRDEIALDDLTLIAYASDETQPQALPLTNQTTTNLEALYLAPQASTAVMPQHNLSVAQAIVNQGQLKLLADSTGYGGLAGTFSSSGSNFSQQVHVRGNTQPIAGAWHYLSFPAAVPFTALHDGVSLMDLSQPDRSPILEWDAQHGDWMVPVGTHFQPGKGYLIYAGTNPTGTYLTQVPHTWTLPLPNYDGQSVAVGMDYTNSPVFNNINGGNADGWNFLGNPFTAPFDLFGQPIVPGQLGFAVRRNLSNTGFDTYVFTEAAANGRFISPNQAFWVRCTGPATQPFVFDAIRQSVQQSPVRTKVLDDDPAIALEIHNAASHKDETRLYFRSEATSHFDVRFDGEKLPNDLGYPNLYTLCDGQPLAVNSLGPLQHPIAVDLAFASTRPGPHRITLKHNSAHWPVFIRDKKSGALAELTAEPYTFMHHTENPPNRFELLFGYSSLTEIDQTVFVVWFDANQHLNIQAKQEIQRVDVELTDLAGRRIFSGNLDLMNREAVLPVHCPNGLYQISLRAKELEGELEVQKIIKNK